MAKSSQRSWANIMLIVYLLMARGNEGNEDVYNIKPIFICKNLAKDAGTIAHDVVRTFEGGDVRTTIMCHRPGSPLNLGG